MHCYQPEYKIILVVIYCLKLLINCYTVLTDLLYIYSVYMNSNCDEHFIIYILSNTVYVTVTICSFPASTTGQYICEKINQEKRVDVDNKFALIKKYSTYSSTVNLHCKKKTKTI